jgi:serine/threonine protein kinase
MRNPHPNIVRYHGCVIKRGSTVGLVFDRYGMTLGERSKRGRAIFGVEACMSRITSAMLHLHPLGLAYNDLNPENILVDEQNNPSLTDVDPASPSDTHVSQRVREDGSMRTSQHWRSSMMRSDWVSFALGWKIKNQAMKMAVFVLYDYIGFANPQLAQWLSMARIVCLPG